MILLSAPGSKKLTPDKDFVEKNGNEVYYEETMREAGVRKGTGSKTDFDSST